MVEETQNPSIDLKDTLEYFTALELIVDQYAAIVEDGEFNWDDASHFIKLITEWKVFANAIKDSGNVGAELKDLDEAEVLQVGLRAFHLVKKLSKSIKKSIEMGKAGKAKKAAKK